MNATAKKTTKPAATQRDHRSREHRMSKLPIREILKTRMADLGIKNTDLQKALGYPAPNVIAMMKTGNMALSETRAVEVAEILQVDPFMFFSKLMQENKPLIWDNFVAVMKGRTMTTVNEGSFLDAVRTRLEGFDVDLSAEPEVMQALEPILKAIVKRERAQADAHIKAIDAAGRAAPKS